MKTLSKIVVLFIALNLWTMITPQKTTAQVSVSFQAFYDDLSPYGNWSASASYGYVWIPNVSIGFTPYATNGHWVFTNVGWTWVSNYPWGWAPFHYGRWYYDYPYGWIWVPDYEWGPAWVVWRRSESCYGWAPIGPGINLSIAYSNSYNLPYNQWTFVRDRDFGRTNINNYYISSSDNRRILGSSSVINNTRVDNSSRVRYAVGPTRDEVQKRTRNTFAPITIRESNKPGQRLSKNELQIYRPRVAKNTESGRKPTPSKVVSMNDVKPRVHNNTETRPAQQPQKQNHGQPVQKQFPNYEQSQRGNDQPVQQKQNHGQPAQLQFPNYEQSQRRNEQPAQQPQNQNHGQPAQRQFPNYEQPQRRNEQPVEQKQNHGQPAQRQFPNYEQPQRNEQPVQQQRQNQGQSAQQQSPRYEQPAQHTQQSHSQKGH